MAYYLSKADQTSAVGAYLDTWGGGEHTRSGISRRCRPLFLGRRPRRDRAERPARRGPAGTAPSDHHRAGGAWRWLGPARPRDAARDRTAGAAARPSSKGAAMVQVENVPGAAGTIGLAQLINGRRGDGGVLLVNGLVMLGAILSNQSPVSITQVTPIARLTGEYEIVAVPASSPHRDMQSLVRALRQNPAAVSWGGGSAGGTDHILAGLIVAAAGIDPRRTNYIAFSGGGEAVTSLIGGQVTAGISGYSEFAQHIQSGRLRAIGISAPRRLANLDVPSLDRARARRRIGKLARRRRATGSQRSPETSAHGYRRAYGAQRVVARDADEARLDRFLPGRTCLRRVPRRGTRADRPHRHPPARTGGRCDSHAAGWVAVSRAGAWRQRACVDRALRQTERHDTATGARTALQSFAWHSVSSRLSRC